MVAGYRFLIAACLLGTVASTLKAFPHHLAYFNEAAGGPETGHEHLLGSNLDWGQDVLFLNKWISSLHQDHLRVRLLMPTGFDYSTLGVSCMPELEDRMARSSVLAVSKSILYGPEGGSWEYLLRDVSHRTPDVLVGKTICVFWPMKESPPD